MTHYKYDTVAQVNRDIEYGLLDANVGDTITADGFGTEGDGGGATYVIMQEEKLRTGDVQLPNGKIGALQPKREQTMRREDLVNRTFETCVGEPLVFLETGDGNTLRIKAVAEPEEEGNVWDMPLIRDYIEGGEWTLHTGGSTK